MTGGRLENPAQEKAHLEAIFQEMITKKRYLSAIKLAQALKLDPEKVLELQEMALKQMAFEYRNAFALRNLAREWGFNKAVLEKLLETGLKEYEQGSEKKRLEQAYDINTGKYLTLRQWVEQFLKGKNH